MAQERRIEAEVQYAQDAVAHNRQAAWRVLPDIEMQLRRHGVTDMDRPLHEWPRQYLRLYALCLESWAVGQRARQGWRGSRVAVGRLHP